MRRRRRLRISTKLFLGLGMTVAVVLVTGLAIERGTRSIDRGLRVIGDVEHPESVAGYEMEINMLGTGLAVLSYLEVADPALRARFENDVADFHRFSRRFQRTAGNGRAGRRGARLHALFDRFRRLGASLMDDADRWRSLAPGQRGRGAGVDPAFGSGEGRLRRERRIEAGTARLLVLRERIDGLLDEGIQLVTNSELREAHSAAHRSSAHVRMRVLFMLIGGLLVGSLAALMLSRGILRSVRSLSRGVEQVGAGQLDQMVELHSGDELEELADSFNEMTRRLRAAEAEAAGARDEALEASRMKSEFLANMSHEVRTPMNGVVGLTDLLLAQDLTEEQREYAELIAVSGRTLLTVVDDILDFSKIEAGRLELHESDFDLVATVQETCELMKQPAQAKNQDLSLTLDPRMPRAVRGDELRLRQVLMNLLSNAVKFTEPGGEIAVAGEVVLRDGDVAVVQFEVSDTGVGISPDAIQKMFGSFTQADASMTRAFGGTGLGLAIVKSLVELMGGEVGVSSEQGEGSSFRFTVPYGPAEAELPRRLQIGAPPASGAAFARGRGNSVAGEVSGSDHPRVLVVEDTPANQVLMIRLLERLGYGAEVAADGREALAALEAGSYAAVLMDCQIPVLDGYAVTRELRRREQPGERLPVIALTAHAMAGAKERCLAAGMDDYLAKPFGADGLAATLERWIEGASPVPDGSPSPR